MRERDLISGEPNRCEAGRHLGRRYVLPRETLLSYRGRLSIAAENLIR